MAIGLATRQDHDELWKLYQQRKAKREMLRLAPPVMQLWDGDYNLRGECIGWRDIDYEFIENDTGIAVVQLSLDHYRAKWVRHAWQAESERLPRVPGACSVRRQRAERNPAERRLLGATTWYRSRARPT